MSNHPLHVVDVFPREKYTGNQLAVVHETHSLSSETMQRIAREMNYSETTFITGSEPTGAGYRVRIFTPQTELPFAGHPTIGTAFVLREHVFDGEPDEVVLDLDIGSIPVVVEENDGGDEIYWMEQQSPTFEDTLPRDRVASIVSLDSGRIDSTHQPQVVSTGLPTLIVPVRSIGDVRDAAINETAYYDFVEEFEANAVFVFSSETVSSEHNIHARMFAPVVGVPEDPATGSSNGCLAAYLAHHQYFEKPVIECTVEQGYEIKRPSLLHLRADAKSEAVDVAVGGRVIPVSTGVLV